LMILHVSLNSWHREISSFHLSRSVMVD
jgi:hypothetical protein